MAEREPGKVVSWYKNRHIFITGGTGYMGKILVEKLLYSCPEIGNVYILIRPKRGKSAEERIDLIWQLPCFNRLREAHPTAKSKIIPIHGDLLTPNLGISEQEMEVLVDTVSVVFHCGATLKLEATLRDSLEQNTAGTERVIDVVKQFRHLVAFVHTSTAFCTVDIERCEEKVYPYPVDPRKVLDVVRSMPDDTLVPFTKSLIHPHVNTYTFTKRLAETLVANEHDSMNVAIVRPSIVVPCSVEPVPGWVDTLNGPMGLLVAGGKGVLRSMHCNAHYNAHLVPCDIAINALIVVAYRLGAEPKNAQVPVYNLTNDGVFHLTWAEMLRLGREVVHRYPFEQTIWYPDGDISESYVMHRIYCVFAHWLPAYIIDMLMLLLRQRRFMVRIQRKIHDGLELLQFFTTRQWHFESAKFLALLDGLDAAEQQMFHCNFRILPLDEYMTVTVLGTRQYCLKEDLSSLPRCRIQHSLLYVLDRCLKLAFVIYVAMTLLNHAPDMLDILLRLYRAAVQYLFA